MLNGVTETIKNETKEQRRGFLSMLIGALDASLLDKLLTGKGVELVMVIIKEKVL